MPNQGTSMEEREMLDIILDRYHRTERAKAGYLALADEYIAMWKLDAGFRLSDQDALLEGREQVTLPTPYNVINLSQRLLSNRPQITVTPSSLSDENSVKNAEKVDKWLQVFWERVNRDAKRNVLGEASWYMLTLGRVAFEVKWVKKKLPKLKQKTHLPISVRTLDPRNVGSWSNGLYTEWAYSKSRISLLEALRLYPEMWESAASDSNFSQLLSRYARGEMSGQDETVEVDLIDYWWIEPGEDNEDGSVWNAIIVDDCFAVCPYETDYPDLPIIVGKGDYGVNVGDEFDGISILHPLRGLWQYHCRLSSQMATGLRFHFWPPILVKSSSGDVADIEVGPGITTPLAPDDDVSVLRLEPNVPMAEVLYRQVDSAIQQATYPNVMYGQEPGSLQAGYGISLLTDAASGRIKNFAESLETCISYVNSFVLCLIEEHAGSKGVAISGMDDRDNRRFQLVINKEIIGGNYENEVKIRPNMPSDEQAKVTLGLRINEANQISDDTFRREFLDQPVPTDEQERIYYEEAMQSDELRAWRLVDSLYKSIGRDEAHIRLFGSELMPPAPEGFEWIQPDGWGTPVVLRDLNPPEPSPEEMMGMGGPGGMPGMPPDMGMGPPPGMGLPPGMGMPPDMGMGMDGPPPIQPEGMAGPMGGMGMGLGDQGLMLPPDVGLPMQGASPEFQAMMGNPIPPGEELDMLAQGMI